MFRWFETLVIQHIVSGERLWKQGDSKKNFKTFGDIFSVSEVVNNNNLLLIHNNQWYSECSSGQFCLMGRIKEKLHDNSQVERYPYGIWEQRGGRDPEKTGSGFIISSTQLPNPIWESFAYF